MLGALRAKQAWQWTAVGKHPVAKDFFHAGPELPVVEAFAEWFKRGYQTLPQQKAPSRDLHTWRFWARGSNQHSLACGVGKDSSDSLGRPYPFLIMGAGPLETWQEHWDLVPAALEETWMHLEAIAARRFLEFRQLEEALGVIKAPRPDWERWEAWKKGHPGPEQPVRKTSGGGGAGMVEGDVERMTEGGEFFTPLEDGPSDDPLGAVCLWHTFLRRRMPGSPHAVFMGGTPQATFLAVFRRPLTLGDFVKLWSTPSEGVT